MCRLLGYVGPARSITSLILEGPHSLEVQSYAPKMMEDALLNADGHGFAWYTGGVDEPGRYRSVLPLWGDDNVRAMGAQIQSTHVLAYVRSATPGIGMGMANTQPFVHGRYAFTHNGYLKDFRAGTMRRIRRRLGDVAYEAIRGTSDSEHLFALFVDATERGANVHEALEETVAVATEASEGAAALMALAVTDGRTLWAAREVRDHGLAPSLHLLAGDGVWVASEPTFDGDWIPFPPGGRVVVDPGGVSTSW